MKKNYIILSIIYLLITGCGNDSDTSTKEDIFFKVSSTVIGEGSVNITNSNIESGKTTTIKITPMDGYKISSVTGCGGTLNGDIYTTGSINSDCNIQVVFEKLLDSLIVNYADIYYVNLNDLNIKANEILAYEKLLDAKIKDGNIIFSTSSDDGNDIETNIKFTNDKGDIYNLPIIVTSTRLIKPEQINEDPENNISKYQLLISGFEPGNFIIEDGGELSFKLENPPEIDPKESKVQVILEDNTVFDVTNYFIWDSMTSTYLLSGSNLKEVYNLLPSPPVDLTFSFLSKDREYAEIYEITVQKAKATLNGALVNSVGNIQPSLSGKKISIIGYDTGIRKVVTVDSKGNFTVKKLPQDTYEISVIDLDNPKTVIGTIYIPPDATIVNFDLDATSLLQQGILQDSGSILSGTKYETDGVTNKFKLDSQRESNKINSFLSSGLVSTCSPSNGSFFVSSADLNKAQTCLINYTVPKGTQNLYIETKVFTAEYPTFTQQNSIYNDTWSYSINGIPLNVIFASGKVNTTHYSSGELVKNKCLNISESTKNNDINITGSLVSTNIGDSALPTTVSINFKNECNDVTITNALFNEVNKNKYYVINNPKAIPGKYISIPTNTKFQNFGIPLEIEYSPKDAKINEVNIIIKQGLNEFILGNFLNKSVITNGKISIKDFIMPQTPISYSDDPINIYVKLSGTFNGSGFTTEKESIKLNKIDYFKPLFLANDNSILMKRRYGVRDLGGDSWALSSTINWLLSKNYRFDDITALHSAQFLNRKSILGHSGHSDGKQIDLRYNDGSGNYTELLGGYNNGSAIKDLINKANTEVKNKSINKPNLEKLQQWINANRSMLDDESNSLSTRKIHIGNSFLYLALVDGKFPDNTQIPSINKWNRPDKITPIIGHLSHWHVSLK